MSIDYFWAGAAAALCFLFSCVFYLIGWRERFWYFLESMVLVFVYAVVLSYSAYVTASFVEYYYGEAFNSTITWVLDVTGPDSAAAWVSRAEAALEYARTEARRWLDYYMAALKVSMPIGYSFILSKECFWAESEINTSLIVFDVLHAFYRFLALFFPAVLGLAASFVPVPRLRVVASAIFAFLLAFSAFAPFACALAYRVPSAPDWTAGLNVFEVPGKFKSAAETAREVAVFLAVGAVLASAIAGGLSYALGRAYVTIRPL